MNGNTYTNILNENHWRFEVYKQRITTKQWREILLNEEDKIIYKGTCIKLKAKNLGAGVVEIYKDVSVNEKST